MQDEIESKGVRMPKEVAVIMREREEKKAEKSRRDKGGVMMTREEIKAMLVSEATKRKGEEGLQHSWDSRQTGGEET